MSFKLLCEVIQFDGMSVDTVAAVANIPQSSLQGFFAEEEGLQINAISKVCETLGLELVRRFRDGELIDYLNDFWEEAKTDIEAEEYDAPKEAAWSEVSDELWLEYANENNLAESDNDEYVAWEVEGYAAWSLEYDEETYAEWESEASAACKDTEQARLEECEWIIIDGE
jgi:hypothetical protein